MTSSDVDRIIEKLAKDVEAAVHALYRGDMRQATARARTDVILHEAREAVQAALRAPTPAAPHAAVGAMPSPRPSVAAPVIAGGSAGWTREEGEAVTRCITAWLPVGPPASTPPDSKCVSAMRDLTPTWSEREKAREAVKRISQP